MIYLNRKDNPITWNKANYLDRAAQRLGLDVFGDSDEYVLNIEPCDIRLGKKWTGLWHIDCLLNNNWENQYRQRYDEMDAIFTACLSDHPRAQLLLQAIDPIHTRVGKPLYDFVSCGSNSHSLGIYQERNRLVSLLAQHFAWKELGNGHRPQEYVKMISQARVQFIRSMDVDGRGEIAQRFFECLAIGPVLTNWVPELEYTGLIEDVDYLAYRSDEELLRKMKILIENEEYRDQVAASGRKKAILHHTYEHRLISILNSIKYET